MFSAQYDHTAMSNQQGKYCITCNDTLVLRTAQSSHCNTKASQGVWRNERTHSANVAGEHSASEPLKSWGIPHTHSLSLLCNRYERVLATPRKFGKPEAYRPLRGPGN